MEIEVVKHFTSGQLTLSENGDVRSRIGKPSKILGCLRYSIDKASLPVLTNRAIHHATVLPVLLYGAEIWPLKARHL